MFEFDVPITRTNFLDASGYLAQDADDHTAVASCLAGDTAAFGTIVERYQRVFFTVAVRLLGDEEEARDATQSAFVSAYRRLETFDRQRRFFSWIYRILVNECLDGRRGRRRFEALSPELAMVGSPSEFFEADERRRRVQSAILALSREYRQVIVLRHYAELSYDEIAEVVGVPVKTVKSRLHTARERLSRMLGLEEKHG